MLNLLKKPPFVRWKFVQRIVDRRRSGGTSSTKAFNTAANTFSDTDTQEILQNDILNQSDNVRIDKSDEIAIRPDSQSDVSTADASNRHLGEASTASGSGFVTVPLEAIPIDSTAQQSEECSEKINEGEFHEKMNIGEQQSSANHTQAGKVFKPETTADNSVSFSRRSKLRNSLKRFKRRSISHIDNAYESVRRRIHPNNYDNLEPIMTQDDSQVTYNRSQGLKRQQVNGINRIENKKIPSSLVNSIVGWWIMTCNYLHAQPNFFILSKINCRAELLV